MTLREEMRQEKKEAEKALKSVKSEKAIHKKGFVSTDLIRLKRKLDHEIIMDRIRENKHSNFMKVKANQEELLNDIELKRFQLAEINKKKMLDVQFRTKVAKLSMQKYRERITEMTNERVWEQKQREKKTAEITLKKVQKLEQMADEEMDTYLNGKFIEDDTKIVYNQLLERSAAEHQAKIQQIKLEQAKLREKRLLKQSQSQVHLASNFSEVTQSQQNASTNDKGNSELNKTLIRARPTSFPKVSTARPMPRRKIKRLNKKLLSLLTTALRKKRDRRRLKSKRSSSQIR